VIYGIKIVRRYAMPDIHHPKRGSKGYSPRKRAHPEKEQKARYPGSNHGLKGKESQRYRALPDTRLV
jgi:hypothetical protein